MKIMLTGTSYSNDVDNWRYIYYKDAVSNEQFFIPIDELKLDKVNNSPVELLEYNLNLQEIPKVMNIMSKQSSYGLDKVIGIKAKFEFTYDNDGVLDVYTGFIIRFYFPNSMKDSNGELYVTELAISKEEIPIGNHYCEEILILDKNKDILNPIAVITGESDSEIRDKGYVSNESISEATHKRTFTVMLTSGNNANKVSEVIEHMQHTYNEHQGQSGTILSDLRKGTYISKLFQEILSNEKRLTCINGVAISSEFTKFYLGSPTQPSISGNLITSIDNNKSYNILTSAGEVLIYIE